MANWEYLDVLVQGGIWSDAIGRSGRLPAIMTDETYGALSPLLNELDAESRELVGFTGEAFRLRLLLRRPRS